MIGRVDNTMPSWCHAARGRGASGDDAVRHLQALLRIDTTNPPGNETPAAEYLGRAVPRPGSSRRCSGATPERKNVVARLHGTGEKPPLLLAAHLDVVPAEPDELAHPPFGGEIHDGYLWGRGAIDMKHMAAMSALVRRSAQAGGRARSSATSSSPASPTRRPAATSARAGSSIITPSSCAPSTRSAKRAASRCTSAARVIYPVQVAEKGACG